MDSHGFTAQSWDEHPDRDEQWKQEELGRIGEERFRREYGCEFLVFDETLVNSIVLLHIGRNSTYSKHGTNTLVQKNGSKNHVVH